MAMGLQTLEEELTKLVKKLHCMILHMKVKWRTSQAGLLTQKEHGHPIPTNQE